MQSANYHSRKSSGELSEGLLCVSRLGFANNNALPFVGAPPEIVCKKNKRKSIDLL
jgi:hypothetical protein